MSEAAGLLNRRTERFDTNFPVAADISGRRLVCLMRNVSMGGCLVEGSSQARVGEIFAVTFGMEGSWESFKSRIIWATTKETEPFYRFGCTFWAVQEKEKAQLLSSLLRVARAHQDKIRETAISSHAQDPRTHNPVRIPETPG